jgi:hypothetical protein
MNRLLLPLWLLPAPLAASDPDFGGGGNFDIQDIRKSLHPVCREGRPIPRTDRGSEGDYCPRCSRPFPNAGWRGRSLSPIRSGKATLLVAADSVRAGPLTTPIICAAPGLNVQTGRSAS